MLAISGDSRLQRLPDVPTFREAGFSDVDVLSWVGLFGPRNLPSAMLDKLLNAIEEVMRSPELRAYAADQGALPRVILGEDFDRYRRAESRRWGEVVERIGLQRQ